MSNQENLRTTTREGANELLGQLTPAAREALLIKCWMSHDARWFMAVANEYGLAVANRLNQTAAHEIGKVEAYRVMRAVGRPPVESLDDYLLAQELFIGLLGPDLLDYRVVKVSDDTLQIQVQRCFAHENAVRAGIQADYECGVFARVTGWLAAVGLAYELNPSLGKCSKCQGQVCAYTITISH
ncbi:MAG: DUF6125 family protein [Chloroflexota bacterium]